MKKFKKTAKKTNVESAHKNPSRWKLSLYVATASLSVLSLITALLVVFFLQSSSKKPQDLPQNSQANAKTESSQKDGMTEKSAFEAVEQTPLYIIGEANGKLAVFAAAGAAPLETYEIYISTLPADEQRRLSDGIKVYSEEELRALIEDYNS